MMDVYALTVPAVFAGCGYALAWGRQRRRDRVELQARFEAIAKTPPVTAPVMPQPTVFDQDHWPEDKLDALLQAVRLAEPPRYIDQEPRWKLEGSDWVLDLTDGER